MSPNRPLVMVIVACACLAGCDHSSTEVKSRSTRTDSRIANDGESSASLPAPRQTLDDIFQKTPIDTTFAIRDLATGDTLEVALTFDSPELPNYGYNLLLREGQHILDSAPTIQAAGGTYGQDFKMMGTAFIANEGVFKGNSATGYASIRCVISGRFRNAAILRTHTYTIIDHGEFVATYRLLRNPTRLVLTESFEFDERERQLYSDDAPKLENPKWGRWRKNFTLKFDGTNGIFYNDSIDLINVYIDVTRDSDWWASAQRVDGRFPAITTIDASSVWINGVWYSVESGPYAFTMSHADVPVYETYFRKGRRIEIDTLRGLGGRPTVLRRDWPQ